jgi:pSer/pThr/pTyr-binding forkhead associated (FHA) protein
MAILKLLPPTGDPVEVKKDHFTLGRDAACDLAIADPSVSRHHAVIEKRGEGFVVLDQQSGNGTFLNGQRIQESPLDDGQELRLGPTVTVRVALEDAGALAMTPAEAAALLGLQPGASAAEVQRRYQQLARDVQTRLRNAPTPSLKRMYQKDLQDLKIASEVLLAKNS